MEGNGIICRRSASVRFRSGGTKSPFTFGNYLGITSIRSLVLTSSCVTSFTENVMFLFLTVQQWWTCDFWLFDPLIWNWGRFRTQAETQALLETFIFASCSPVYCWKVSVWRQRAPAFDPGNYVQSSWCSKHTHVKRLPAFIFLDLLLVFPPYLYSAHPYSFGSITTRRYCVRARAHYLQQPAEFTNGCGGSLNN